MTVRITYDVTIDSFVEHPVGELSVAKADWDVLKQYHVAVGCHCVSVNASGGSEHVARQILGSKIRFTEVGPDAPRSAFVNEDE